MLQPPDRASHFLPLPTSPARDATRSPQMNYGWTDFFSKACAYHTTPAAGGKSQIGYAAAPNYGRLCIPTQFAYLCNK